MPIAMAIDRERVFRAAAATRAPAHGRTASGGREYSSMNRMLLPAGLVLAGLVAFDRNSDQTLRLAELEQQPRCTPEPLTVLRQHLESERAEWASQVEQRWSNTLALASARAERDARQIAKLEAVLEEQQESLDAARRGLAQWESIWSELAPSTIERELHQLQVKL